MVCAQRNVNPVQVFLKLPVCFSIASYRHSLSHLRLASRADRAVHSFSRLGLPRLRPAHRYPSLSFPPPTSLPHFETTNRDLRALCFKQDLLVEVRRVHLVELLFFPLCVLSCPSSFVPILTFPTPSTSTPWGRRSRRPCRCLRFHTARFPHLSSPVSPPFLSRR